MDFLLVLGNPVLVSALFIIQGLPWATSLTEVKLTGPAVIESGHQPWYELTCSCEHTGAEMAELDIKWYHGTGDSPFLQWVPGAGGPPQTVNRRAEEGNLFRNRIKVRHVYDNSSGEGDTELYRLEQVVRVLRPSVHLSGDYTCKVATFFTEHRASHTLVIYDPGIGPSLSYSTEPPLTLVQCRVQQVYPEPRLELSVYSEQGGPGYLGLRSRQSDVTTTTVRRGLMYDVTVNTSLATALLSLQTVFSCTMLIPGTQFSLKEDTMYLRTDIRTSASHVYSRGRVCPTLSLGVIIVTGALLRKV